MSKVNAFLLLHAGLLIYSFCGVFMKYAAAEVFFSPVFLVLYFGIFMSLAVYALLWQRVLAVLPLTIVYANKSIIVLWGVIWGVLLFGESISFPKAVGGAIIIAGILVMGPNSE